MPRPLTNNDMDPVTVDTSKTESSDDLTKIFTAELFLVLENTSMEQIEIDLEGDCDDAILKDANFCIFADDHRMIIPFEHAEMNPSGHLQRDTILPL